MIQMRRARFLLVALALLLFLAGCTTTVGNDNGVEYRYRSVSKKDDLLSVRTSVLSATESYAVYGEPLFLRGIQPVWIEIENRDQVPYWLLSPGLDPNFYPASEAADAFAYSGRLANRDHRFKQLAFSNPVPPASTVSGFVLTNLDEGIKMVHLDLVADGKTRSFSLLNEVPGFRADFQNRYAFLEQGYQPKEVSGIDSPDALRAALEKLPCCVTNEKGTKNADPLNLVIVGGIEDAFPALVRRGWQPTEQTWYGSIGKMMTSALSNEPYPYAPISPLYLFGRSQDLALQKARDNIHQRNHLRLWLSPMQYRGRPVWVGQISRDIGTRLTRHSPYLTTHKIDPDVDEARTALVEDLAYSQNLHQIGLVKGVEKAARENPRSNLTGDPYFTDGFRAVLIFGPEYKSLEEIEFLAWELPEGGFIEESSRERPK